MARKKQLTREEIGRIGGHARAKSMSPRARRLNALAAVTIRWQRYRGEAPLVCRTCGRPLDAPTLPQEQPTAPEGETAA
jgi:hypothetical protein